ncbi:MAG TPA: SCO family protein [Gammaproteobacteria bacterium]|jgi:protein SCO1/2
MLRILVIALVALVAAMLLLPRPGELEPPLEVATVLDAPRPLPAVTLTDHRGEPFAVDALTGRDTLVFFGFTNCPDICPITLGVIAEAMEGLRDALPDSAPQVLFVSVDAERDSPERINAYIRAFDDEFIGVTADDATLAPLLDTLSVTVHKQTQGDEVYNVVHNGTIYVLDESGDWIALFGGSSHRAETLISDYLGLRARRSRG